jgi:hypothetical protein
MPVGAHVLLVIASLQAAGTASTDIRLTLACGKSVDEVVVSLHNPGPEDTAVLLGRVVAGARHLPQELMVEATIDQRTEQLAFRSAELPRSFASRMDHWVVELPVAATFMFTLRSGDFISTSGPGLPQQPRELAVRLNGRPVTFDLNPDSAGMRQWRLWTGTAVSNRLRLAECSG